MSRSMKKKLGYVVLGFLLAGGGGAAAEIDPSQLLHLLGGLLVSTRENVTVTLRLEVAA